MCWNAEVSLQSFLMGMSFIGIGAYLDVSLPILFFCLTIVFMQLIEYIVWSNYEDPEVNRQASISAFLLLALQPIASIMTVSKMEIRNALVGSYIILSLFVGFLFPREYEFRMERAANGHLSWKWLTKEKSTYVALLVYFIFLFAPLLMNREYSLLSLSFFTLTLSLYSYWKENTWGSMWCWIVNGIVPFSIANAVLKR